MKISEQQIVKACRTWFMNNRAFFNIENIAQAISEDLRVYHFAEWIYGSDVLNNEDEVAAVDWAKEHGFTWGTPEPVQAEFTVKAEILKRQPSILEPMKRDAARDIGLHLLKNGFLEFVEMGDVTKPGEPFRTLGFRLIGRAVKLPSDEKK